MNPIDEYDINELIRNPQTREHELISEYIESECRKWKDIAVSLNEQINKARSLIWDLTAGVRHVECEIEEMGCDDIHTGV